MKKKVRELARISESNVEYRYLRLKVTYFPLQQALKYIQVLERWLCSIDHLLPGF